MWLVSVFEPVLIVQNCTFVQNSNTYGGAMQILLSPEFVETSTVVIEGSQFISNAAEAGGAIFIDDTGILGLCRFDIVFNQNSFYNNSAVYGGYLMYCAVVIHVGALFSGSDCIIKGNLNTYKENFAEEGSVVFLSNSSSIQSNADELLYNGNNFLAVKNLGNFGLYIAIIIL